MPWARFEDRFHENPKVREAWRVRPQAVGLYSMSITYCAGNLTDGFVPVAFVESLFRRQRDESAAVAALVDAGLWVERDGGWSIPDFLEFNESRLNTEERRARNAANGQRGGRAKAKRTASDSLSGSPQSRHTSVVAPTRPDPDPTRVSPNGETTDREVVVVPAQVRESAEVEKACDVLAAAGVHVHDRSTVTRLAGQVPDVDIVEAAIRAANWARDKTVKHPFGLLRQFVEDDDAPKRGQVPKARGRHLSPVDHYAAMADPETAA